MSLVGMITDGKTWTYKMCDGDRAFQLDSGSERLIIWKEGQGYYVNQCALRVPQKYHSLIRLVRKKYLKED